MSAAGVQNALPGPVARRTGGQKRGARARAIAGKTLPWALLAVTVTLWAYGVAQPSFTFGERAGRNLWAFALEMATVLPAMFILVGLFDVWVPRWVIERHLGADSGALAVVWMVLLGMLQAGPLYAAFPVAVALWRKGSAPRNVLVYLFSFSALKIPMLTFEVGFLGWQFSLVRTAVTLPVFIALAFFMERLLPVGVSIPAVEVAPSPHREGRVRAPR